MSKPRHSIYYRHNLHNATLHEVRNRIRHNIKMLRSARYGIPVGHPDRPTLYEGKHYAP